MIFVLSILGGRNIDLPRKIKYKPRKKTDIPIIKNSADKTNKTFNDFVRYVEENSNTQAVKIDTVHVTRSGKVLLTMHFKSCSLLLAFLMDSCNQNNVKNVIDKLHASLDHEAFTRTFPIILTDNGFEFTKPETFEFDSNGIQRTKIFYCDPLASYQKQHVEKKS